MDRKTTDFSHVAVVVARADKSLQQIGDRLEKALAAADQGEKAPVRMLSGEREFTAVEQAGNFADARKVREALEAAFKDDADICVTSTKDRRKKLLICDMDSTIIQQECLDELADFAGLKAEISAITERAMRGELEFEGALRERVGARLSRRIPAAGRAAPAAAERAHPRAHRDRGACRPS